MIYAIGTGTARRTKILKTRETNLRRAKRTLIKLLAKNKKWVYGRIYRVVMKDGEEMDIVKIYETRIKGIDSKTYMQQVHAKL